MESILYIFGGNTCVKNRLEEIRRQRGIRQEELASALEVSRQTIGSLENGRYNPSIILAFKIARYFEMSIEDIFIYEEIDNDEKEL
jgi:putative transcriptional regulator